MQVIVAGAARARCSNRCPLSFVAAGRGRS